MSAQRAGSSAMPRVLHDIRAASGPMPLGATGCDRIASRPTATERYCRRAPEANVNAASSLAARCAVARGGKAASELTASSAIATCLIRDVAPAQGWCHAPTRAPECGPSHYATIRAHRGSISVAPMSHSRHEAPGRPMGDVTLDLPAIRPSGEPPRRRHNAKGITGAATSPSPGPAPRSAAGTVRPRAEQCPLAGRCRRRSARDRATRRASRVARRAPSG